MKMLTVKLKPKTIFGILLILTGVAVMAITFYANHAANSANAAQAVLLETDAARAEYLASLGWEFDSAYTEKQVTIPAEFNTTYTEYNELQLSGGFDLTPYKGQEVTVYTYNITNYTGHEGSDCIYANLLLYNNRLIGGDVCSTSVSDGFIQTLEKSS